MRLLILGGTTEARRLAERLAGRADVDAILSLAGRTDKPERQAITTRIGGFGGVEGLADYLRAEKIERVIDATHPFAAQMSRHAVEACSRAKIPLLVFTRAPWRAGPDDLWTEVACNADAARALGESPRRVFLTIGRLGLADFAIVPQHAYLIRTIDPPGDLSWAPDHRIVFARGPFAVEDEIALMRGERIDVLVTKNSGGGATEAKLEAARNLRIPVVLIAQPKPAGAHVTHEMDEALAFALGHATPPIERGV
jgi:precorrin-6A/cobalt-precorrin-6A reductase